MGMHEKVQRLFVTAALGLSVALNSFAQDLFVAEETLLAMGTLVSANIVAPSQKKADALLVHFEKRVSQFEKLFTMHGSGPLREINNLAGQWVSADCDLVGLIELSKQIAEESDRAFEPTIGPVVNLWKIGFQDARVPSDEEVTQAASLVDFTQVQTDLTPKACRARIAQGQQLDLGAIAKGWIGTRIVQELRQNGASSAIVNLGGNVVLLGKHPSGREWRVGVQNPKLVRNETNYLMAITAADESVVTSGAYERKLEIGGKTYGHILSAVTGRPVDTDIASVTIVDKDGAKADAWCTAFYAMGIRRSLEILERRPDLHAIILGKDQKKVWVSNALTDRISSVAEGITVHPIIIRK